VTYDGEQMRRYDRGNRTERVAAAQLRMRGPMRVETTRSVLTEIGCVALVAGLVVLAKYFQVIP
jgi:hypothetical protein